MQTMQTMQTMQCRLCRLCRICRIYRIWRTWRVCRICRSCKVFKFAKQTYQTKLTRPNQTYLKNLPNQTYQTKSNLAYQAYWTKPKLLVKAADTWVRSAFGNVLLSFEYVVACPSIKENQRNKKRGLIFAIENIFTIAFTIQNIFISVSIGQLADGVRALDFKPDDPRLFLVNERVPPPKNLTESCFYICNPADHQISGWNWRRSHLHGNNRIFIFSPGEYIFPCQSIRKCSFDLQ